MADFPQHLASCQMTMGVVDALEMIEIQEDDSHVFGFFQTALDGPGQRDVQIMIVEQAGEIVSLSELLSPASIEDVLDGDGDITGEDAQQIAVLFAVFRGVVAIDQLEDATHVMLDPNGNGHQRLALVLGQLVYAGEEEFVVFGIRGVVCLALVINVTRDALVARDLASDQVARFVTESGDKGQHVGLAVGFLLQRIVEQDRACFGGHKLIGFAQYLRQVLRQVHFL